MLRESNTAQKEKGVFRRWFEDDYFILIVWYNISEGAVFSFQLCYNKYYDEHALTWERRSGFLHNRIDNKREPGKYAPTPILVDDGIFPAEDILKKFMKSCKNIDEKVSSFVVIRLIELIEKISGSDKDVSGKPLSKIKKIYEKKYAEIIDDFVIEEQTEIDPPHDSEPEKEGGNESYVHKQAKTELTPDRNLEKIEKYNRRTEKKIKDVSTIRDDDEYTEKRKIISLDNIFTQLLKKSKEIIPKKKKTDTSSTRKNDVEDLLKKTELLAKKLSKKRK